MTSTRRCSPRNPVEQRLAGGGKEDIQGVLDYIEDLRAGIVRKS